MSKATQHPHGSTGTPATVVLRDRGIAFNVHTYDHDPAAESFGMEAAGALGISPDRVFKTLLVESGGHLAVAIIPVNRLLDLKAMAAVLGHKRCVMAAPPDAERSSGYVVGGISPIGQRRSLPTVLDDSAAAHETVLVSGGRRGLDLELTPADLATATAAKSAPISRPGTLTS